MNCQRAIHCEYLVVDGLARFFSLNSEGEVGAAGSGAVPFGDQNAAVAVGVRQAKKFRNCFRRKDSQCFLQSREEMAIPKCSDVLGTDFRR